jgi:LacI family transcriptional regulator
MSSRRPTIKDVAARAGVSFKTVSRVINGQPGVREEVRRRVLAAIAELGYVVNQSARALALGQSRTIGVIIPRLTDPHSFDVVHHVGLASERRKAGVIILTRPTLPDALSMSQFIGHGLVGALLLVAPRPLESYLPLLRALRIPTVICETPLLAEDGSGPQVAPCVVADNRGGAYAGTSYLLSLGHRQIAFIQGAESNQNHLRFLGYRDALADHGLPLVEAWVRQGRWTWESGYAEALALLALPQPPTAIFCANDAMALGAMRAIMERGWRVPEDISVLGFDDIPAAAQSTPPLTTVRQPTPEIVEKALDLLIRGLDGASLAPTNYVFPTSLVVRGSCAAVNDRNWGRS